MKTKFGSIFFILIMSILSCICFSPKQVHAQSDEQYLYYMTPLHYKEFFKPSDQSYRLYRIGKDGQNQQQLSQGMVLKYQVAGDWIYYYSAPGLNRDDSDHQYGEIYRMKKDGTNVQRIDVGQTRSDGRQWAIDFVVVDDWIYYIDDIYKSHKIWRFKADGTQNSPISSSSTSALALLNNRIYFSKWYEGKGLYSMKLDGSDIKTECPDDFIETHTRDIESIMSRGGWLGYQNYIQENKASKEVYALYNPSTGSKIKIPGIKYFVQDNSTKRASSFYYPQLLGEYNGVYLLINQDNKQNVVVCQPGSDEPKTVVSEDCTMAQLDGDTLYYITASDNKLHSLSLVQNTIKVLFNGSELKLDNPPVLQYGRVLVPIRPIAEAMGAQVSWNPADQSVGLALGRTSVSLTIGSTTAYVNGQPKQLDVPAQIIDGSTLVPLRFVSEGLGAEVSWDPATRTASITYMAVITTETRAPQVTSITVNNGKPIIQGQNNNLVPIQFEGQADAGIKQVQFFVVKNGIDYLKETISPPTTNFQPWDTSYTAPGSYQIKIVITDFNNATGELSKPVEVKQAIKPSLEIKGIDINDGQQIIKGANNNQVPIKVILSSKASPSKVRYFIDGARKYPSSDASLTFTWNISGTSEGYHEIKVIVTDQNGIDVTGSASIKVLKQDVELDAPQGLIAEAVGPRRIDLKWNQVLGANSYVVHRTKVSDNSKKVFIIGNLLSFIDTTVEPANKYYYAAVAATESGREGKWPQSITVQTPALGNEDKDEQDKISAEMLLKTNAFISTLNYAHLEKAIKLAEDAKKLLEMAVSSKQWVTSPEINRAIKSKETMIRSLKTIGEAAKGVDLATSSFLYVYNLNDCINKLKNNECTFNDIGTLYSCSGGVVACLTEKALSGPMLLGTLIYDLMNNCIKICDQALNQSSFMRDIVDENFQTFMIQYEFCANIGFEDGQRGKQRDIETDLKDLYKYRCEIAQLNLKIVSDIQEVPFWSYWNREELINSIYKMNETILSANVMNRQREIYQENYKQGIEARNLILKASELEKQAQIELDLAQKDTRE